MATALPSEGYKVAVFYSRWLLLTYLSQNFWATPHTCGPSRLVRPLSLCSFTPCGLCPLLMRRRLSNQLQDLILTKIQSSNWSKPTIPWYYTNGDGKSLVSFLPKITWNFEVSDFVTDNEAQDYGRYSHFFKGGSVASSQTFNVNNVPVEFITVWIIVMTYLYKPKFHNFYKLPSEVTWRASLNFSNVSWFLGLGIDWECWDN